MELKVKNNKKRYSLFPIQYQDIWEMYKKSLAQLWVVEEADLSKDKFNELQENEKEYLKNILAFFTISDGLVIENIISNFMNEIDIMEVQFYYGQQNLIEQIHAEGYALLIDTYITNVNEKTELFDSMQTNVAVQKKATWAEKWISHPSFVHRLIAFACVEGLSFSSVFAGVFWYRSRNKMAGLGQMNQLILDDESAHYEFAVYLYNNYVKPEYKLSADEIKQIIIECYDVEKTFVEESMPAGLTGLTKDMMIEYVQYVTDIILKDFGLKTHFNAKNPLDYMARIGLTPKNNFFESRVGQYTRVEIPTDSSNLFDEDF